MRLPYDYILAANYSFRVRITHSIRFKTSGVRVRNTAFATTGLQTTYDPLRSLLVSASSGSRRFRVMYNNYTTGQSVGGCSRYGCCRNFSICHVQ